MATKINSSMASKQDENAWKAVVSALEGSHGSADWDTLGGEGIHWESGQMWQAKCACQLDAGSHTGELPQEAYHTVIEVLYTDDGSTSLVYVPSGTTFTVTVPKAQMVILTVRPTQATK